MALVIDRSYRPSGYGIQDTIPMIRDIKTLWPNCYITPSNWETLTGREKTIKIYLHENDSYYLEFYYSGGGTSNTPKISVCFGGTRYHEMVGDRYPVINCKFEKTTNALIMSIKMGEDLVLDSVSATDCDKIIFTKALNSLTQEEDYVMIWMGSHSSGNSCMMFAPDVVTPSDISAQNANTNVNARTTNLIPIWSTRSGFVTTDMFYSLCENISSWYFGYIVLNGEPYRMSGQIFVADE